MKLLSLFQLLESNENYCFAQVHLLLIFIKVVHPKRKNHIIGCFLPWNTKDEFPKNTSTKRESTWLLDCKY